MPATLSLPASQYVTQRLNATARRYRGGVTPSGVSVMVHERLNTLSGESWLIGARHLRCWLARSFAGRSCTVDRLLQTYMPGCICCSPVAGSLARSASTLTRAAGGTGSAALTCGSGAVAVRATAGLSDACGARPPCHSSWNCPLGKPLDEGATGQTSRDRPAGRTWSPTLCNGGLRVRRVCRTLQLDGCRSGAWNFASST